MNLYEELIKILNKRQCKCYEIDEENLILNYTPTFNECTTLNSAISEITAFLIINNIPYSMQRDYNITINSTKSELCEKYINYTFKSIEDFHI